MSSKPTLTDADVARVAASLDVEPAALHAVAEVEAAGRGFEPDGRPRILYERHWFHRLTDGRFSRAHPDLSNRRPGGYLGGSAEHSRLARAALLDREAALQSCSWGLFQIMGFHWDDLGYTSLQEFINAAYRSEADHLDMLARFLCKYRMVDELQTKDWRGFARQYNGPAFAKNAYDLKLARAYAKHSRRLGGGL